MSPETARRVAVIAVRSGWPPNEVLATDPVILDEVLAIYEEQDEQQRRDSMRQRLKGKLKGG